MALSNASDLAGGRKRAEASLRESHTRLEQAATDLQTAQQQMVQQERLRALGQMASGIAHDFNNTLSPIMGFSELLLIAPQMSADPAQLKEYLQTINMAAKDAAKVVSRLREFYRFPPRCGPGRHRGSESTRPNRCEAQPAEMEGSGLGERRGHRDQNGIGFGAAGGRTRIGITGSADESRLQRRGCHAEERVDHAADEGGWRPCAS